MAINFALKDFPQCRWFLFPLPVSSIISFILVQIVECRPLVILHFKLQFIVCFCLCVRVENCCSSISERGGGRGGRGGRG